MVSILDRIKKRTGLIVHKDEKKDLYLRTLAETKTRLDVMLINAEHLINDNTFDSDTFLQTTAQDFCLEIARDLDTNGPSDPNIPVYITIHAYMYLLARMTKPKIIIETGVERGGSTYMFLKALKLNGFGELHSFDKSPWIHSQWGIERAPLVPRDLVQSMVETKRWFHYEGASSEHLPSILEKVKEVNLAAIMSDHSYKNQSYETRTVWPYVKPGSYVVIDRPDYEGNDFKAWDEFLKEWNPKWTTMLPESKASMSFKFGVMLK